MFSEPNINTSPLLEKGAKGNIKYFDKYHCTRFTCSSTKWRTFFSIRMLHVCVHMYIPHTLELHVQ